MSMLYSNMYDMPLQHVNPQQHASTLEKITLHPELIDSDWIKDLDLTIQAGSRQPDQLNPNDVNAVDYAQKHFIQMLGFNNPEHAFYPIWLSQQSSNIRPALPATAFSALVTLDEITNDPIGMVLKEQKLLRQDGSTTRERFNCLSDTAFALGWRGSVQELVIEEPRVLRASTQRINTLGCFVTEHAQTNSCQATYKQIKQALLLRSIEEHLQAVIDAIQSESTYNPLDIPLLHAHPNEIRGQICDLLTSDSGLRQLLGNKTLKAYFMYKSPTDKEHGRLPWLQQLLDEKQSSTVHANQLLPVKESMITGQEHWLDETDMPLAEPALGIWKARFNQAFQAGSQVLDKEDDQTNIKLARETFFTMLGWNDPHHSLYKCFAKFKQTHPDLLSPAHIVDFFTDLLAREVEFETINDMLLTNFACLSLSPQLRSQKLEEIIQRDLDLNRTLKASAGLLKHAAPVIGHILDKKIASGTPYTKRPDRKRRRNYPH